MFFDDGTPLLSQVDCEALLAGASVGRLSLSIGALPVVVPVHYRYLGGSVIIAMRDGRARRAMADGNIVAMGVDNADRTHAFWTVLVIGRADEVTEPDERAEFQTWGLLERMGTAATQYLRLWPDLITGYGTITT